MKSALIIITVVVYVLGSVGLPILSYSCPMTGQTGVTVDMDDSPPVCLVDLCCETRPHTASVRLKAGDTCCDVTALDGVKDSQTILSGFKYGAVHRPQASCFHLDGVPAGTHEVTTRSTPNARSPINSPLLI
jgi:hypothetical protein